MNKKSNFMLPILQFLANLGSTLNMQKQMEIDRTGRKHKQAPNNIPKNAIEKATKLANAIGEPFNRAKRGITRGEAKYLQEKGILVIESRNGNHFIKNVNLITE